MKSEGLNQRYLPFDSICHQILVSGLKPPVSKYAVSGLNTAIAKRVMNKAAPQVIQWLSTSKMQNTGYEAPTINPERIEDCLYPAKRMRLLSINDPNGNNANQNTQASV